MTSKNIDRIKIIAETEGISVRQMEIAIGCSNGVLSRAIKNGTDIQGVWLSKIIETFPNYNAEWLLTGNGDILKRHELHEVNEPAAKYKICNLCIEKERIIRILEQQLENSLIEAGRLHNIISNLSQQASASDSSKRNSA